MSAKPAERDDGGDAFPHVSKDSAGWQTISKGASLRDYFAVHAPEVPESWGNAPTTTEIALWRWEYADTMLETRSRQSEANRRFEALRAVLLDPDGKCCIRGSDEDKRIIERALAGK